MSVSLNRTFDTDPVRFGRLLPRFPPTNLRAARTMRKCCCCISVHGGSIFLAILGITLCLLELVPIMPFLLQWKSFNPIQENLSHASYVFKEILKEHNATEEEADQIVANGISMAWIGLLVEAILSGVFVVFCLLMICGVATKKRKLMLPYLTYLMAAIVIFVLVGFILCGLLCFVNLISGLVGLILVLVITVLMAYFWRAVQMSYKELGCQDYMYSLAPMDSHSKRNQHNSPQQFDLA
ncbi:hypothetical protein TCAL_08716 [Tigriopus californicus]|uniref:Uncharacterized protein n=1 Tax=Tigriopus californicus TaxID=6832 RepID=A0A553P0K0_TIGCA|nr:hypothetical protein TCAL_08716 [Tigriopus californicus]|eukprot:TCALIF_08716-PA protein Name:"Protein of unknown function" AED:0.15 eAED:0.15 QI:0/0/0.5/0.5/1/1/2/65/238